MAAPFPRPPASMLFPLLLLPLAAAAAANHYRTLADVPAGVEGLSPMAVQIVVDPTAELGPLPPIQGDLSQGAETGDPFFFEEMQDDLARLAPRLIRVSLAAAIDQVVSLDDDGALHIDFSLPDRIVKSLRATGTQICWNHANWPESWDDGYPKDLDRWAEFTRRFVEHYNGDGQRDIHYIEFWNEPGGFDRQTYEAMARAAKAADPGVKVGGPAVLDVHERAIRDILEEKQRGVPVDFVSYHLYYRRPWDYPKDILRVQAILEEFPGCAALEHLITEWGVDMGESGVCDTRFNAVYYLTSLEYMMPLWPQVRPCHFELREGWDWKGPSRDLFGRWGMLTYSNLLRKPVFQAAEMWARMADRRVFAASDRDDIRVLAAKDDVRLTILVWSFPREYAKNEPNDPVHGPPLLDTPVRLVIPELPFASTGVSVQRFVLDHLRSNVNAHPGQNELACVQDVLLAFPPDDRSLELDAVVGTHTVHLWVIRPAERAPADVEAVPDRLQIWAGESAEVTIRPRHGDDFPLALVRDPIHPDGWSVETVSQEPLRLRIAPERPETRGTRYFAAWVQRTDWGALGRALAEFRTDSPVRTTRASWRADTDGRTGLATTAITVRNIADKMLEGSLEWDTPEGISARPRTQPVRLAETADATYAATFRLSRDLAPGPYPVQATVANRGYVVERLETIVHQPFVSQRQGKPPTIDGDLSEWRGRDPLVLTGKEHWGGPHLSRYEGEHDCSALAWSGWDETYLYFAVEVRDPTHYAPVANREMYKYDCLHLGFDLRRDMLDPTLFFEEDDCDYLFAHTDRGVAYRHWGARRPEEVPEKVLIGAQRTEDGRTHYEVALPWKEEFEPYAGPEEGRTLGLALYLHDFDHDPEEEEGGYLRWGRGLHWHTKRPALFWALFLGD